MRATLLILVLLVLPTLLPFFNPKFFYTQDHIFIARLNQISTALSDGHFPVRWVPDLRYGEPLFNYYAPLPYYIGALIHLIGFNFIWVSKILFILSTTLSALTMYILAKELFGKKGGYLAAILYTYAPYRAVDTYVRGALSETWAFVFIPLIFYFSLLLAKRGVSFLTIRKSLINISFLTLSLAGLFLTHNVTTLMFLPFLVLWWIYLLIFETSGFFKRKALVFLSLCIATILAFGLSAFFLLPANFERNFIQTKYLTVGYFNFRAHFVAFRQFFSLFWGYGSSLWGPVDGLSFQVGLVNWIVILLSAISGFTFRRNKKMLTFFVFLILNFFLSLFLQHNKSAFIWEAIPLMAFIQFPWRFLTISIFIVSLIGGAITSKLNGKLSLIYFILIIASLFFSLMYFKPKEYADDAFFDKFLNKEKMHQGIDLTKDYLPIWVKSVDKPLLNYPEADEGIIQVENFNKKAARANSIITVYKDSIIDVPITYFPGWTITANNKNISLEKPDQRGLIKFKLPKGDYSVGFEFRDTPVRILGNTISLFSLLILFLLIVFKKGYKNV
ncbi:hypothetical protein HYW41_01695 [Candidatus Daviesbacteria bacterium]|nr:hypothetical protein [Candidatus Daviesbacteria bacterium]